MKNPIIKIKQSNVYVPAALAAAGIAALSLYHLALEVWCWAYGIIYS
jgi:hypothetical protein